LRLRANVSRPTPATPVYRADVDGLRAVAILAVVTFHAWPSALPGGFVGVDVFFVISGFLISAIVERELAAGAFSFAHFYARRIRRLFPALIVVLVAALALGWVVLVSGEYRNLGREVGAGAGFVANLLFWSEAGYFDAAAQQKPLLHLWSLGVEEQFYMLWPLALWAARRWRIDALWAIGVVAAASFAANLFAVAGDPASAFYLPQCRFWELMLGAGVGRLAPVEGRLPQPAALAGAALIALALIALNARTPYPGIWALAPTLGAALLIAAGPGAFVNRRLLASAPMVWLGLRSYPLYLWHWPLLFFSSRFMPSEKTIVAIRFHGAALLLALVLAATTYGLVENGVRRLYRRRARLVIAGLCTALGAVGVAGLAHWPPQSARSSFVAFAKLDAFAAARHTSLWREGACFFLPGDAPDEPAAFLRNRCDGGPSPRRPLVLLIGDSHAADLYPGLAEALGDRYTLGQLTVGFCVPLIEEPVALGDVATDARCRADNQFVFERVAAQKPDLIVATAHFLSYETNAISAYPGYDAAAVAGVRELQRRSGAAVLVVGQSPIWTRALPSALEGYMASHPGAPPTMGAFDLDARIFETDARLKATKWGDRITYVSLLDRLCALGACRVLTEGEFPDNVIAYDANHLSESGSRHVAETILKPWIEAHISARAP
jgi:peptidoglycan/LPS O-acetylase OafA/YrhL